MKSKGIKFLIDSCNGMPAIVVGIGPSLDAAIPELKKAQGKAIIVATDAAFRPLMANGIRPDLVLSFDCKQEQGLVWNGVPAHDVPLLIDVCAHPDAIASWKGPVLFYNHYHESDEFSKSIIHNVYTHIGNLPSGGTVGNSAVVLTKALGCSIALLVGMDFCYGSSGDGVVAWRYRAQDYDYIGASESEGKPAHWGKSECKALYDNDERLSRSVDTPIGGKTFKMDPELIYYHDTLLGFLAHFKLNTINCSEAGVLSVSDKIKTMLLAEAIEKFCKASYQDGRTVLRHLSRII
jgi:hypothetical protein